MKTKAQIVQELLEKHQITAEDAVVLLMAEREYIYIPSPYPSPSPIPYQPDWYRVTNDFPVFSAVN